mmetsp:Transcript_20821/g.31356  ORF Transcript_20821/g.31356 Transcript_20821/m.31356 type:complete len:204 (+) Transcript_20821:431-1042(+)
MRVKPIPLRVLRRLVHHALALNTSQVLAIADMITLAFFFLLFPGEYTGTPLTTTSFRLYDVQLFVASHRIDHLHTPEANLSSATFGTLKFTDQKNGVRGEVIGHGVSTDPLLCPVRALRSRIHHLRSHRAPSHTPLGSFYASGTLYQVSPAMITAIFQATVATFSPSELDFTPRDISACSLRAGGAMALLCAGVDTIIVQLTG